MFVSELKFCELLVQECGTKARFLNYVFGSIVNRMEAFNEFPPIDSSSKEVHWKSIGKVGGGEILVYRAITCSYTAKTYTIRGKTQTTLLQTHGVFNRIFHLEKKKKPAWALGDVTRNFLMGLRCLWDACCTVSTYTSSLSHHVRRSQQVISPCAIAGQNAYGMSCSTHWASYFNRRVSNKTSFQLDFWRNVLPALIVPLTLVIPESGPGIFLFWRENYTDTLSLQGKMLCSFNNYLRVTLIQWTPVVDGHQGWHPGTRVTVPVTVRLRGIMKCAQGWRWGDGSQG